MTSKYVSIMSESTTGSTTSQNQLRHVATTHLFQTPNTNTLLTGNPAISNLFAASNFTNVMAITGASVGIGTTAPLATLHLNSSNVLTPSVFPPTTTVSTNLFTVSGASYGNGTYYIISSSFSTGFFPYYAVSSPSVAYWQSGSYYSALTGLYTGSAITNGYAGEWIQIQLPSPVILYNYTITGSSLGIYYAPKTFNLYGSGDGVVWYLVDSRSNIAWTSTSQTQQFTINNSLFPQTAAYIYYRLVINSNGGNGPSTNSLTTITVGISNWGLNGIPYTPLELVNVGNVVGGADTLNDQGFNMDVVGSLRAGTIGYLAFDASGNYPNVNAYLSGGVVSSNLNPFTSSGAVNEGSIYFPGYSSALTTPGSYINFGNAYGTTATSTATNFNWTSTDFSIEAWIYLTTTSVRNPIAQRSTIGTNVSADWSFYVDTDNFLAFFYNGTIPFTLKNTGTTIPANTWTHVAVTATFSGGTLRMYINGTQQNLAPGGNGYSRTGTLSYNTNYSFTVGYYNDTTLLNGFISNLRVVKANGSIYTASTYPISTSTSYPFTVFPTGSTALVLRSVMTPLAAITTNANTGKVVIGPGQVLQQQGQLPPESIAPQANITLAAGITNIGQNAYPPSSMTANVTSFSNLPYGNGMYIASCSTLSSTYQPYNAFSNISVITSTVGWRSGASNYSYVYGSYTASNITSGFFGDYIQLQLPTPIVVSAYQITPYSINTAYNPSVFNLYGSSDGANWILLDSESYTYPSSTYTSNVMFTVNPMNANQSQNQNAAITTQNQMGFNQYRLVVNKTGGVFNDTICIVPNLRLFGTPYVPGLNVTSGNVGIALPQANPAYALDVNGPVRLGISQYVIRDASGNYTLSSVTAQTPNMSSYVLGGVISSNVNPFIANASTATTSEGSIYFPGTTGSYINFGNATTFNPLNVDLFSKSFTIEAWVNPSSLTNAITVASRRTIAASPTSDWDFTITTAGYLSATMSGPNTTVTCSTTALAVNTWYHIAMVYTYSSSTNGTLQFYVNGTCQSMAITSGTSGTTTPATQYNKVAATTYTSTNSFVIGYTNNTAFANAFISNMRVTFGSAIYTGSAATPSFTPSAIPLSNYSVSSLTTTLLLLRTTNTQVPSIVVNPNGTVAIGPEATNKMQNTLYSDVTLDVQGTMNVQNGLIANVAYGAHLTPNTSNAVNIVRWIQSQTNGGNSSWWATSSNATNFMTVSGPPGSAAYSAGVFLPDQRILFVPYSSATFGYFAPSTNTYSTVSGAPGSTSYSAGVLMNNGNVCLVPYSATYVGIVNPITNSYTTVGSAIPAAAYSGGVLLPTGAVFMSAFNATYHGLYTPSTNTYSTTGTTPGTSDFAGCVLTTLGLVVLVPYNSTKIGIYNPFTNTYYTLGNITLTGTGAGAGAYYGGVLLPDGTVLFVPYNATSICIFNPFTNTANFIGTLPGSAAYRGGIMVGDKVFFIPYNSSTIGVYTILTRTYSLIATGSVSMVAGNYSGGVIIPDGRAVFVPYNGTAIGIYNQIFPFTKEFCISPLFNKF